MATAKSYLNVKIDRGVKETLDEQIIATIRNKNIPNVRLKCDKSGNLIVDKEKHPELYDWLENG